MTNNNNLTTPLINNGTLQTNITQNNKLHLDETDLPRLGRKRRSSTRKSVSFNNDISIEKVENWKKYNVDMSKETEVYKLKKEVEEYKALKAKKLKEQNACCCEIF